MTYIVQFTILYAYSILGDYGMGFLETECGVLTDSTCDVTDSIVTFLHLWGH